MKYWILWIKVHAAWLPCILTRRWFFLGIFNGEEYTVRYRIGEFFVHIYYGDGRWLDDMRMERKISRLMYEDDLPADMTDEEYKKWFEKSSVLWGVRMGPKFKRTKVNG
jgi:hypothetical protein